VRSYECFSEAKIFLDRKAVIKLILKSLPAFHYKSSLRCGLSILIGFIDNLAANILGWVQ